MNLKLHEIISRLEMMGYVASFDDASDVLTVVLKIDKDYIIKVDVIIIDLFSEYAVENIVKTFNCYIAERGIGS